MNWSLVSSFGSCRKASFSWLLIMYAPSLLSHSRYRGASALVWSFAAPNVAAISRRKIGRNVLKRDFETERLTLSTKLEYWHTCPSSSDRPAGISATWMCSTPSGGAFCSVDFLPRSEEHTSKLQSHLNPVCLLLLKNYIRIRRTTTNRTTNHMTSTLN